VLLLTKYTTIFVGFAKNNFRHPYLDIVQNHRGVTTSRTSLCPVIV